MANPKENSSRHQQCVTTNVMTEQQQQQQSPTTPRAETSSTSRSPPSPAPSSVSTSSSTAMFASMPSRMARKNVRLSKFYTFIGETYRDIRKYRLGLCNDVTNTILVEIINKYRKGIYEVYSEALDYQDVSQMLSNNIEETLTLLQDLSTKCINLEEYYQRVCELVAIFISCALRVNVGSKDDNLTGKRIVYTMRKYLIQDDDEEATLFNILRTLVYAPRLFNTRDVMCQVFASLIPLKPCTQVKTLPDKLYMLYIIVFYRWMKMQKDDEDQQLIVNYAKSFMKPMVSLCTNMLYCQHLPLYTRHSEATRMILKNIKFYKDLKNACIIDNAFKVSGTIVNLCEDDEVSLLNESAEILSFAELFSAVQLEVARPAAISVKREEKTIVDSVDLTVDEEDDDARDAAIRAIRERHENWLNNPALLAKQYLQLMKRQKQQREKTTNVICLDSDSEGDELSSRKNKEKETNGSAKKSTGPSATQTTETEDLFADSYPITVTPLECNANLESSDNEEDNDDGTKMAPRFMPPSLRTYEVKKSSSCSVSSAEDNGYRSANQHDIEPSAVLNNSKRLPHRKDNYRRNSLHLFSSPPFQQADDNDDSSDEDVDQSMGPGVPFEKVNSTLGGGKVIFSQAMPSRDLFHHSDSQEEQVISKKSNDSKSKRVHFDSSPMGPTSAYSKQKLASRTPMPQHSFQNTNTDDYFRPVGGEFESFKCAPNVAESTTSATASISNGSSTEKHKEHIAAAATLFRNIFDRPRNTRLLSFTGNYPSMLASNLSLSPKHQMYSPRFDEEQLKKSLLKRSRLKQRRSTICGRSDFNDYMTQCSTMKPTMKSMHRDHDSYQNFDWEGLPLRERVSDHLDIASASMVIQDSGYQDEKLSKRCAVVIKPTEELLQYERERDAMYNEILQKQRRKLELRAIEKMKEKERRRQEKQQKREQFQLEQTETMKQLERMKLSSRSDEEATQVQVRQSIEPTTAVEHNETKQKPLTSRVSPEKRRRNSEKQHVSDVESQDQEPPPPKRSLHEKQLKNAVEPQPTPPSIETNTQQHPKSPTKPQLPTPMELPNTAKEEYLENANSRLSAKPAGKSNNTTKKTIKGVTRKLESYHVTADDIESSESDKIPLLQRIIRHKKSSHKVKTESPSSPMRKQKTLKSSQTTLRPIRECRQSVAVQNNSLDQRKARGRRRSLCASSPYKHQQDVDQTTDSEFETRRPARISKERRRNTIAKSSNILRDTEFTTDSEKESEQRPGSALRQSPRFAREQRSSTFRQRNSRPRMSEQSDSEIESQDTVTTNMSPPPTPLKGRLKLNNNKNGKQKPDEAAEKTNGLTSQPVEDNALSQNKTSLLNSEKEDKLTEQNIVAVIAQRLSSPDSTLMQKEIETAEHEEILETLEDLLQKETSSSVQLEELTGECTLEYIKSTGTTGDVLQATKTVMVSTATPVAPLKSLTTESDVDMHSVIENIVINEIQREMDAESCKIPHTAPTDFGNTAETDASLAIFNQTANEVAPALHGNQPVQTKRIVINFEEEILQEMLGKSLVTPQELASGDLVAPQATLPLLITNVQSLSHLEEKHQVKCSNSTVSTKDTDSRQQQVLITENILLAEGLQVETHTNAKGEIAAVQTFAAESDIMGVPLVNEMADISLPTLTFTQPPPCMQLLDTIVDTTMPKNSLKPPTPVLGKEPEQPGSTSADLKDSKQTETEDRNEANKVHLNGSPKTFKTNEETKEDMPDPLATSLSKSSRKMPTIKACFVRLANFDIARFMKNQKRKSLPSASPSEEMIADAITMAASPPESVDDLNGPAEDCRSTFTPEYLLPHNIGPNTEEELPDQKTEQSKLLKSVLSPNVASFTSPTTEKPKSKTAKKTVTFNLVAEIIPISPYKRHSSPSSLEDREQTPPNDYHWNDEDEDEDEADDERIYRYYSPMSMVTPAARKTYNDDLMTTSNTSTSCSSSDTEEESHRQKVLDDIRESDIRRLLNDCSASTSSASENNSDLHRLSDYIAEEVVVETSNHPYRSTNGALSHIRSNDLMAIETTETLPVYLFSDEIVDIAPTDSIQVSSTYITNAEGDLVKTMDSRSLMSCSEQEVSSTQESYIQTPIKSLTNEDNSLSATKLYSLAEINTSADVLQNNQVDTTNHSPEICLPLSRNSIVNAMNTSTQTAKIECQGRRMSVHEDRPNQKPHSKKPTSYQEKMSPIEAITTSKLDHKEIAPALKNTFAKDINTTVAHHSSSTNEDFGRNSPSTTTSTNDDSDKHKVKNFIIPKLTQAIERSESPNLKYTTNISGARNPFIQRPIKPSPENPNHEVVATQKKPDAEISKQDYSLTNSDAAPKNPKNVVLQKQNAKDAQKPERSLVNESVETIKSKPKDEVLSKQKTTTTAANNPKADQPKDNVRMKAKSNRSVAKEDVSSTKSLTENLVQQKQKTETTTKTEHSLAKDDASTSKHTSDSTEQQKAEAAAKSQSTETGQDVSSTKEKSGNASQKKAIVTAKSERLVAKEDKSSIKPRSKKADQKKQKETQSTKSKSSIAQEDVTFTKPISENALQQNMAKSEHLVAKEDKLSLRSRLEKAEQKKQKEAQSTKSKDSIAKEVVTSIKPISENAVQQKMAKSEHLMTKEEKSSSRSRFENDEQKKQKEVQAAKSEGFIAKEDVTSTKPILENAVQQKKAKLKCFVAKEDKSSTKTRAKKAGQKKQKDTEKLKSEGSKGKETVSCAKPTSEKALSTGKSERLAAKEDKSSTNHRSEKKHKETETSKSECYAAKEDVSSNKPTSEKVASTGKSERLAAQEDKSSTNLRSEQKQKEAETSKSEGSTAKEDVSTNKPTSENALQQKAASTGKSERLAPKENKSSTKPKSDADQQKVKSAATAKSESSIAKEDISSAKSKSENELQHQPETTQKSERVLAKEDKSLANSRSENAEPKTQKNVATANSESSIAKEDISSKNHLSENNLQQKAVPAKSECLLANDNKSSKNPKTENTEQKIEKSVLTKSSSASPLPQKKTAATKRESSSTKEHETKRIKRNVEFTELQETIDVEIFTMATELKIPKCTSERANKTETKMDKPASQNTKSKEKLKDYKARTSKKPKNQIDEVVAVNLIKVSDLRELTTTGIKSAVSHGCRRYSPKRSLDLNRNSPRPDKSTNKSSVSEDTTKNAPSTESSSSNVNENTSKANGLSTVVGHDISSNNLSDKTAAVAKNPNKTNNLNLLANANSVAKANPMSVQALPAADMTGRMSKTPSAVTASAAAIDASYHVRKKQRTK